ncbi:hypothetical protein CTI12_AA497560 [Artemisia annua]|uniref:Retrovirus-related Pol polyprotein from transposon TNT 1-94-like beta-barrel domain-containing protein n=1 Tax=Artemisia annua TaxID=35608 RepID=A0A2U1LF40_ARTAN|nr:hypothetical protein CTI12_AA497560 [Artemisia annua]
MLSSMRNDLMLRFVRYRTAKEVWEAVKLQFGGTSTTRLHSLNLRFDGYTKRHDHSMRQHLIIMSNMIAELNTTGRELTDEEEVQAVIKSLTKKWNDMKLNLTHNGNIKTFDDVSRHLELEEDRLGSEQNDIEAYVAESSWRKKFNFKRNKGKGVTYHITRDRAAFVDYRRIPRGSKYIYIRNDTKAEAFGIATCKLKMRGGRTLYLHDVLYAPDVRRSLVSVLVLLNLGYKLVFDDRCVDLYLGITYYGTGHIMDGFMVLDTVNNNCKVNTNCFSYVASSSSNVSDDAITWHARLGQVQFQVIPLLR